MRPRPKYPLPGGGIPYLAATLFAGVFLSLAARAASLEDMLPRIRAFLPQARQVQPVRQDPPYARVLGPHGLVGLALLTDRVHPIPGYSGKPIDTLVVLDPKGHIRGLDIVSHQEPILLVGVSDRDLDHYTGQYVGIGPDDVVRIGGPPRPDRVVIDGLSGATITAMVLNASITQSLRDVVRRHGLLKATAAPPPASAPAPIWIGVWRARTVDIAALGAGLATLLVVLLFQDWLVLRPRLFERVRTGFLLYTLVFIGWYGLAQLSVVNVFTFVQALFRGFQWESFLIDPFMFLLWAFVAGTVLLWGRGVYCGWLCPFGALQELGFRLARRLGLPSWEPPAMLHERLWALKYLVLLGLFGLSLHSFPAAERAAEVEPFKTAITLRFARPWPFVTYALGLLAAGLFVRKGYCRYLCPLGAALTFPSRFRIFDWLRRRRDCGRPCQTCARECEVQAIRPTGEINELECHYCLDCQVTYWDDHKCPPLVERRRRDERRLHAKLALEQARHAAQSEHPD
jgi:hypothetical protein